MPPRINVVAPQSAKDAAAIKGDAILEQLSTMTMAEVEDYVENNVTDLASAKAFIKKLAKVVAYMSRQI
jgi:hypothetical protein